MQTIGHRPLLSICLLYLLLAFSYAWATPPLESSDEYKHFPVVDHILTTGQLVVLDEQEPGKWLQEGAQPPLYYWLMAQLVAQLVAPIYTSNLDELHQLNSHAYIGNPNQLGNKNLILHDPALEAFPWQDSVLAIYLIRFASIGLGLGTLFFAYKLGDLLFGRRVGLLAAGLTAVNPMFLFISAAVNNDSLAALLGAAGIYLLCATWLKQRSPAKPTIAYYIALGILCGLSMLTKLSLAGLLLLAGLLFASEAYRQKAPRLLFVGGLTTFIIAMLLVAPWLYRNLQLYGDLTGLNPFIAVQGTRDNPTLFGVDWLAEWGTFYRSYWGLFGGVNIFAPQWFYTVCNWLLLLGLMGWLIIPLTDAKDVEDGLLRLWRQRSGKPPVWPLLLWIAILFVLLVRWNIISPAFQGRLIFPALTAVNTLWAAGLLLWADWLARWRQQTAVFLGTGIVTILGFVAALLPFTHIAPVYAYPEPLTAVPIEHQFGPYRFRTASGQQLALIGVDLAERQTAVFGTLDGVDLTLYWTLEESPVDRNFITAVDLLGRQLESAGRVNRYPGGGLWPTSRWQPGEIYADHYYIPIAQNSALPVRAQIKVGVLDENPANPTEIADMAAFSPTGEPLTLAIVGAARLVAANPASAKPQTAVSTSFTDGIELLGYDAPPALQAGDDVNITFYWQASVTPALDYTVFFQLLTADLTLIASGDSPPLNGDYPTSWWQAGDHIVETRTLTVPETAVSGQYLVAVGLYDPTTGVRLPLRDGGDAITWTVTIENR